jgi:hypothetical protein
MTRGLMNPTGLERALTSTVYSEKALIPASPWLGTEPWIRVSLNATDEGKGATATWQTPGLGKVRFWVLQARTGGAWRTDVLSAGQKSYKWSEAPNVISVSALDRFGALHPAACVQRQASTAIGAAP